MTQHPCLNCERNPTIDDTEYCAKCLAMKNPQLVEEKPRPRVPRCPKCMARLPSWAAPCGICAAVRRKPGRKATADWQAPLNGRRSAAAAKRNPA